MMFKKKDKQEYCVYYGRRRSFGNGGRLGVIIDDSIGIEDDLKRLGIDARIDKEHIDYTKVIFNTQEDLNLFKLSRNDCSHRL